jgi:hypothetical protein
MQERVSSSPWDREFQTLRMDREFTHFQKLSVHRSGSHPSLFQVVNATTRQSLYLALSPVTGGNYQIQD